MIKTILFLGLILIISGCVSEQETNLVYSETNEDSRCSISNGSTDEFPNYLVTQCKQSVVGTIDVVWDSGYNIYQSMCLQCYQEIEKGISGFNEVEKE